MRAEVHGPARLGVLCVLEKSVEPRVEPVPEAERVSNLLAHAICPNLDLAYRQRLLDAAVDLAARVPQYFLHLDLEADVWRLLDEIPRP